MKAQGVALQGALAVAGLVAAFLVWQREPEGAPGEVTVMDAPVRSLERVRYEDEARFVELFNNDEAAGGELWLRLGQKPAPPPAPVAAADGGTQALASVPPAPVPPPRELRANEVARKLFSRFAPLKATRGLGTLDDKTLAEVGLTGSARRLVLTVGGAERAFALAKPAGGWGSPYLRSEEDGRVFLLGTALLPDLEAAASRLVDRELHSFKPGDYDTLVVRQGEASRTFVAAGTPPGPTTLAPQDAPDKPDDFARNWHERVWRLVPVDFLGRGEAPPGGEPQVAFRVEYLRGQKPVGELTVARGDKGDFYARTERTPGWTRLHSGMDTLAEEASKVAAGR